MEKEYFILNLITSNMMENGKVMNLMEKANRHMEMTIFIIKDNLSMVKSMMIMDN